MFPHSFLQETYKRTQPYRYDCHSLDTPNYRHVQRPLSGNNKNGSSPNGKVSHFTSTGNVLEERWTDTNEFSPSISFTLRSWTCIWKVIKIGCVNLSLSSKISSKNIGNSLVTISDYPSPHPVSSDKQCVPQVREGAGPQAQVDGKDFSVCPQFFFILRTT